MDMYEASKPLLVGATTVSRLSSDELEDESLMDPGTSKGDAVPAGMFSNGIE